MNKIALNSNAMSSIPEHSVAGKVRFRTNALSNKRVFACPMSLLCDNCHTSEMSDKGDVGQVTRSR